MFGPYSSVPLSIQRTERFLLIGGKQVPGHPVFLASVERLGEEVYGGTVARLGT